MVKNKMSRFYGSLVILNRPNLNVQQTTAVAAKMPNLFTVVRSRNSHADSIFPDTHSFRC